MFFLEGPESESQTRVVSSHAALKCFEFTLSKRRAGKAEMNLIRKDHRVTSKPWQ